MYKVNTRNAIITKDCGVIAKVFFLTNISAAEFYLGDLKNKLINVNSLSLHHIFIELPFIMKMKQDLHTSCFFFISCYLIYFSQHSCKILVLVFILIDEETD